LCIFSCLCGSWLFLGNILQDHLPDVVAFAVQHRSGGVDD
jgi:hypothetical protein